jgi:hypothetical protein
LQPLKDIETINARLDCLVSFFKCAKFGLSNSTPT